MGASVCAPGVTNAAIATRALNQTTEPMPFIPTSAKVVSALPKFHHGRMTKSPRTEMRGLNLYAPWKGSGRDDLGRLFGQDGQAFAVDVGEAALDVILGPGGADIDGHQTLAQGGHERGVVRQDAEVALDARRVHLVHQAREYLAFRRDEREAEFAGHCVRPLLIARLSECDIAGQEAKTKHAARSTWLGPFQNHFYAGLGTCPREFIAQEWRASGCGPGFHTD